MTLQEILLQPSSKDKEREREKTAFLLQKNKESAAKILLAALNQLDNSSPQVQEVKERIWI